MSWWDDLSIRLLMILAINTIIITSLPVPDDDVDSRQFHQVIPTASIREQIFQVNTTEEDATGEIKDSDDESEGVNIDEYEGELRDIAESHEAMSRDDVDNSTDGVNNSGSSAVTGETLIVAKDFNSHEKSVEEGSDESMTSNEAISREPELDLQAEKLLNFKRKEKQKNKRIPSVKKELNTQKEIQESDPHINDTRVVIESKNVNMDDEAHEIFHNVVSEANGIRGSERFQVERKSLRQKVVIEHANTDSNTESPQVVERRAESHQSDVEGREEYLLPVSQNDVMERDKIGKQKKNEYTLAESLMDLLMKLAENPSHWERAHKLLKDVEDKLKLNRVPESNKQNLQKAINHYIDSTNHVLLMKKPESTTKKPKKKKKKKKTSRYQSSTASTISAVPTTTPTTMPSDSVSKGHWRVIVDRLFRPSLSFSPNSHAMPNIAKVHYSVSSKQLPSSISEHHFENPKYHNENSVVASDPDRQYTSLGKFHFGKINTHEKGSSQNQHDSENISEFSSDTADGSDPQSLTSNSRNPVFRDSSNDDGRDDRYNQYIEEEFKPFGRSYLGNYQVPQHQDLGRDFSRHRGYYEIPWGFPNRAMAHTSNPYLGTPRTKWVSKYELWKNSHEPMIDRDNEYGDRNGMYRNFEFWSPRMNMRSWPYYPMNEIPRDNGNSRNAVVGDENKNRSKINEMRSMSQNENDINGVKKITMKTWDSLTSDPRTWPLKLSNVKPWPKDKNGNPFNPNASLVRKLGLGMPTHNTEETKITGVNTKESSMSKMGSTAHQIALQNSNEGGKISSEMQSMNDWNDPPELSTWKPYVLSQRESIQNSKTSGWPNEAQSGAWRGRIPDWDERLGMQSLHTSTWPPRWKQFTYHKVNMVPITKSGVRSGATQRTRNSFIAISATSPLKYPGNEWRKNDIEDTSVHNSLGDLDGDDLSTQLLRSPRVTQNTQSEDNIEMNNMTNKKGSDQLEYQLENLRENNLVQLQKRRSPSAALLTVDPSTRAGVNQMNGKKESL